MMMIGDITYWDKDLIRNGMELLTQAPTHTLVSLGMQSSHAGLLLRAGSHVQKTICLQLFN